MASQTHATLLERLRDGADPMAWEDFFRRYWRLIYSFARHRGCSEQTADDILQDVMLTAFQQRQVFQYDPTRGRFRDWLATVVRNLVAQHRRRPSQRLRGGGADAEELAQAEDDVAAPDGVWEAAFEESLLAALLDVVRHEVSPESYQAFELLALNEVPGSEVAAITGLSRNAVYLARRRVLARLKELGAAYREEGQLDEHVRLALKSMPRAAIVRAVTSRPTAASK
jgi:RNA polymerase sigma factor (sigma-70 family)